MHLGTAAAHPAASTPRSCLSSPQLGAALQEGPACYISALPARRCNVARSAAPLRSHGWTQRLAARSCLVVSCRRCTSGAACAQRAPAGARAASAVLVLHAGTPDTSLPSRRRREEAGRVSHSACWLARGRLPPANRQPKVERQEAAARASREALRHVRRRTAAGCRCVSVFSRRPLCWRGRDDLTRAALADACAWPGPQRGRWLLAVLRRVWRA